VRPPGRTLQKSIDQRKTQTGLTVAHTPDILLAADQRKDLFGQLLMVFCHFDFSLSTCCSSTSLPATIWPVTA